MLIESDLIAPGFDQDEVPFMVEIPVKLVAQTPRFLAAGLDKSLNAALNSSRESAGGRMRTTMEICSSLIDLLPPKIIHR
jgi:hypothetical protein